VRVRVRVCVRPICKPFHFLIVDHTVFAWFTLLSFNFQPPFHPTPK
jgi:hypothetical protein